MEPVSPRKPSWPPKTLFRLLSAAVFLYVLLVGLAMLLENTLIYHPLPASQGDWAHGPEIRDVRLRAADGTRLDAWYQCANPPTRAVVLFLHGNGGNLTSRAHLMGKVASAPADVFALDYRGYGRSGGLPSEQGLYQDADAGWHYLTVTRGVPAAHIVVFGESLGGAVAVDLARRVHPAGLIVQSSFTSMPDEAVKTLPFVPRLCVRTQMRSLDKIGLVRCPTLFIHSRDDNVVPYWMGRRLFAAARGPKFFFTLRGASHSDTEAAGGHAYYAAIRHFLRACVPPKEHP